MKVRVVRQITGVDSNRLQPIIRFHPDADFRVEYITIEPLDYNYIFGKASYASLNNPTALLQAQQRRRNAERQKNKSSGAQSRQPAFSSHQQALSSEPQSSTNTNQKRGGVVSGKNQSIPLSSK